MKITVMKKLLFLTLSTILLFSNIAFSEDYDFRKTKWGMSKAEVKKNEKAKFVDEGADGFAYKGKLLNFNVLIIYRFLDNKLSEGIYSFEEKHMNDSDYIADFNTIKELLIKKYGAPYFDTYHWKNNMYREDIQRHGTAISMGHLILLSKWETDRTNIDMILKGTNLNISHGLLYKYKNTDALKSKDAEKKDLNNL